MPGSEADRPTRCLAAHRGKLYPLQGPCAGQAPLAQSAERFHGKEKVNGSIPLGGSVGAGLTGVSHHQAM